MLSSSFTFFCRAMHQSLLRQEATGSVVTSRCYSPNLQQNFGFLLQTCPIFHWSHSEEHQMYHVHPTSWASGSQRQHQFCEAWDTNALNPASKRSECHSTEGRSQPCAKMFHTTQANHARVTYRCRCLQKKVPQKHSKPKPNNPKFLVLFHYSSCNAIKVLKSEQTIDALLDLRFTVDFNWR